jgi:hypothetical protein
VYGGAIDIARDNMASGLRSIRKFVQTCAHTNVLILNVRERYDLLATSYVNNEVVYYNRMTSKLIKCFDYAQVVKDDLQREQYMVQGMHVNRQGKHLTARYLVWAIHNMFTDRHRDLPIILKWGEDPQDRGSNAQESTGKGMFNGDSELTANMFQENLDGDIIQNIRSDITQSVLSEAVQSLDCRFLDKDETPTEVKQIRIENTTVPITEQPSVDRKRVKKPPKTRSEDFYGLSLSIFWVVCKSLLIFWVICKV